ncbi:MAG: outer membrane protein assembly factor BamA [Pelagibacterales bacterium]|nr:outer membrane protein assembly factor BamA [Pelagibacterales bacterium]
MVKFIKFTFIYLFLSFSAFANEVNDIKEIKIDGLQRINYDTVLSYGEVNIEVDYTESLSNNIIKKLYDTQLFSDISVNYIDNILTINVKENPTINLVLFEGNKTKKDEDLIAEIKLKERSVFSRNRVKEDVKRILELYQRSGRLSAQVDPSVELLDNNRVNLIFKIDEAKVLSVSKITIIGNKVFTDKEIKKVMTTKSKSLLKFWSKGGQYDPDRIEYDKQLISDFYNKNGYVNFLFTSSIAQLVDTSNKFEIILSVSEGERFSFGKIKVITQLDKLNKDVLKASLEPNSGNIFNSEVIKESIEYIKNSASSYGYTFIEINPEIIVNDDSKTVDVTFDINEGPKVYVNRINIEGNTRTIDKVIRREFTFSEGDAYNKFSVNYSKDKIKALNYFESVELNEERVESLDRIDLNLNIVEKNTGSATLGAGYGSTNGSTLTAGITESNFLGKGQKVKLSASLASTQSLYDISITEPYFNNKDLSVRADLYSKFDDPTNVKYETETVGLGLSFGFPLSNRNRITTKYSLLTSKTKADTDATSYEQLLSGTNTVSILGYVLSLDKRNSPYKPTNGSIFTIEQNIAGIGGTSNYVENKITYKVYKKLSDLFTGAIKSELGAINGYGGKYAPVDSQFNIGGKNLRGFKYGKIGPQLNSSYTGGNYYYVITTETNFDLPIDEFDISSSLFLDVGSVWGLDERYGSIDDSHKIRASIGLNLNWDSAIGPINFILAEPVMSENNDTTDKFSFDIGYNF